MKQKLSFIYLLITLTLSSQNIQIEKLDIKDGLPDNSVRNIIQDQEGYLWFGTLNGLSRFDGNNFKNYNSTPEDSTGLTNSRMVKIKEDKKGFIWCWSDDNNLQRLNPITNEVINLKNYIREIPIKDFRIVSNGDIWVWGNDGCARIKYSDENESFSVDVLNKQNGFENVKVNFIFEDNSENIWAGTKTGLVRINFSDKGTNINTYFKNKNFISFDFFKENIWFGTLSNGIYKYSFETKDFDTLEFLNSKIDNKPIVSINQINSKLLLIGSDKFLFETNIETGEFISNYDVNFNWISKFFIDSFNDAWFITRNRGIFKYSSKSKKISYYALKKEEREFLGVSDKLKILEDRNKNIWIGIHGGGVFLYNRSKDEFKNYRYDEEKYESISSDIVLSLFKDSSNNLWVGTMHGGVTKISLSKENFTWHIPLENSNNFFDNEIRTSVEDKNNKLWIGSKGGKIFCYEDYELKLTLPDDLSQENQLKIKDINVYSLYIDHEDNLWVGTKGKGLFVLKNIINKFQKKLEIVHFSQYKSKALNDVYSIIQDKYKNYWIGSHGLGLSVLSNPFNNNSKITTYKETRSDNGLISNYVRYLYFDKDQNLWIATSVGLNLLLANEISSLDRKFISIENIKGDNTSLSYNDIDHVFQGYDENIYVSTMGGGLNILNYKDLKNKNFVWKHLDMSNGLSSNKIFATQQDLERNIWVSTSLGINKYYPRSKKIEQFLVEKEYGLNYFTEGCATKLSNGDFLFGHHKGVLTFNPKNIIKDTTSYPIVLSKFFINGNEVLPKKTEIINKNIGYENDIKLAYTQNTIRFDFSVLDFKNPDKIQYSYKLDNFDESWSIPLTNNSAVYQNLPHGKYTFMLKATNSDGVELPETLRFNFKISPPFLKSYVGYFLVSLLFGLIFFTFLYLYKKQISAKQGVVFTDKLNEKKLKYYTNISHEFKTPLTLISCHLQDIIDDNSISDETKFNTKQIQRSTSYLLNLVEQILDFRKIREDKMKLSLVNIDIVHFVKNISSQFLPLAKKEGINLIFNIKEEEIFGFIDVKMMKKVVYNILSNAIKFTPENKTITISLELYNNNNSIKIIIKDEGVGISIEDQKNLFERFYKSENSSGIGLFYVKELVVRHKGTINVDSVLNEGTCVTINLPINRDVYADNEINNSSTTPVNDYTFFEPIIKEETIDKGNSTSKKERNSILIIDDNDEMRSYLSNKFKSFFKVFEASNGEEGVKVAINELPDIIVCDVMMPVMGGIETIKLLRENFNTCHIPIVLLTANSSEHKKMEGIKVGADDFITKPFNFKYLKLKVDALISQRNKIIQSFSKNPELSMSIITNSEEDKLFVEKVKQLVEDGIGEAEFGVNALAANMGLSRTGFYKKIKDITGETPHEFISAIQMKKAALMLKKTNYSIKEIGSICGFNDSNYFSKIFKKHFGKSPKAYQLEYKQ